MEYVPQLTAPDLQRLIRREFPREVDLVGEILAGFGSKVEDDTRVHVAILKLSGGRIEELRRLVQVAKDDYRDVLGPAEYPELMRVGPVASARLSADEIRAVHEKDWQQYCCWLEGR